MDTYDLIVIGGGSAGLAAAEYATRLKNPPSHSSFVKTTEDKKASGGPRKIALIEDDLLGGGSLWSGCIPSKTLLHEAHRVFAHGKKEIARAYKEAQKKIKEAEQTIAQIHDNPERFKKLGVDVHIGRAQFTDPHTIAVGNKKLTARFFLVATGSSPAIPEVKGLGTVPYLTTDTIFELDVVPKSLIIVGGGPNGVELAQAFNRLGVTVTVLHRGERLLSHDDEEISAFILKKLRDEGVIVQLRASLTEVSKSGDEITVAYKDNEGSKKAAAEAVLMVTGRKSNVDGLELKRAGVVSDEKGVQCNSFLQSSVPHIYIAGDVGGEYGFTHYAAAQGVHAVSNMFMPRQEFNPKLVPWVTFCDPEAAHVGMTEGELKKSGKAYRKLFMPYSEIDRAITDGKRDGFIKVLVGQDGLIQGAQIVGERAGELIHEIVIAMEFGISQEKLASVIHAYPTYSSGLGQIFFGIQEKDKIQNKENKSASSPSTSPKLPPSPRLGRTGQGSGKLQAADQPADLSKLLHKLSSLSSG